MLGLLTKVLTAATDSMIPAYMIHGSGNFFKKLSELGIFTNELIIVGTVAAGLITVAVYIAVLRPWSN